MVFDKRPWICFYGGSPKPTVFGTPCTTAKVAAACQAGLCSSYRTSCASLRTRLLAQSLQHRLMTQPLAAGTSSETGSRFQPTIVQHLGGSGTSAARGPIILAPWILPPGRLQSRSHGECSLATSRASKGTVAFPEKPWSLEQPRLPPRVECKPLRGCLCLPATM